MYLFFLALFVCTSLKASGEDLHSDSIREKSSYVDFSFSAITEGQWNLSTGRVGWANRIDASMVAQLWRETDFEVAMLATYKPTETIAEVCQDFSNINAPSRLFRLVHIGLQKNFCKKRFGVYIGLRQADEDYFNTPLAGLSTGASCGCVPTVNDNFHVNVFPLAAFALHLTYVPKTHCLVKTSLYNGYANDSFCRSFRFRPHADGVINLGSVNYVCEAEKERCFGATYLLGWNLGRHFSETFQRCHSQAGYWVTIEQPLMRINHVDIAAGATWSHEFKDPEVAKKYWNVIIAAGNITRHGGTLACLFNRAYYRDSYESELELTCSMPINEYLTLQPAIHHYSTCGLRLFLGQFRVIVSL